jgi:hypothetical protein
MSFNENAFMIAGTAIAIFGVGLYLYDTRKEKVVNAYNQYRQPKNYAAGPPSQYSSSSSYPSTSSDTFMTAGSRRNKKRFHRKTKKHR